MEHALDWLSLTLRWIHIITGVAWIGASFYFNWLNNNIREPEQPEPGVGGDVWSVHGGHFYRVVKYKVAPERLPKVLHWFKWEAYFTWITGFALLCVVYYLNPTTYLIDSRVRALSGPVAVAIGIGTLAIGWVVYHLACKSPLGKKPVLLTLIGFPLLVGVAYGLTQTFGSRAAYMHVGALIGTIMAANVFFVIIPNQRVMVDAMIAGKEPAAEKGLEAAQRSLHNNYFTLPVLFIMVSNHYPVTFGHPYNWAILAALSLIGAAVRHWFNLAGKGQKNVYILPVAAIAMVALALVTKPKPPETSGVPKVAYADVKLVLERRCVSCHSPKPENPAFPAPPQGVTLDTPDQVAALAPRINTAAVVAKTMPLGNLTQMTDQERELLGTWISQGADTSER